MQPYAGTPLEPRVFAMGKAVATLPPTDGPGPHCSIAHTEQGWLLVIRDEECSVMQVFGSLTSAQLATERMHAFFEDMRDQGAAPNQSL